VTRRQGNNQWSGGIAAQPYHTNCLYIFSILIFKMINASWPKHVAENNRINCYYHI
jgi:hypothetical protein